MTDNKTLKGKKHIFRKIILSVLGLTAAFLLFSFIRHRVLLAGEEDLLTPPGRMIDVDGHKMHVYSVGKGDKTLVLQAVQFVQVLILRIFTQAWAMIAGSL